MNSKEKEKNCKKCVDADEKSNTIMLFKAGELDS
jgi:hypothetical protein